MPMPKLLKKLSRKSLRGNDSEPETDSESPPPLPLTEYDSLGDESHRNFLPPSQPFPSAKSSPASSARPSGDWSHQVIRSISNGSAESAHQIVNGDYASSLQAHSRQPSRTMSNATVESAQYTANGDYARSLRAPSRQASQNAYTDNTHPRLSYAPPSGSPPPRSRASSSGSRPASYAVEGDPRARVYSPSQLGYHQPPLIASNQLTASPTGSIQGVEHPQAPNDDLSRNLAGAWEIANTAPKVSKVDQVLLVAGESLNDSLQIIT